MGKLSGKRAVVTGGSRGMGCEIVRLLAAEGAQVAFTGRSISSVDRAMQALGHPEGVTGHAVDVRKLDAMAKVMAPGCDFLINNAAVTGGLELLHEKHDRDLAECLDVNLLAPIHLAGMAVPRMIEAGGGTIVNVSSGAAQHTIPGMNIYSVSKAGLAMATLSLHTEYGDKGIRAFGFQPGIVDTEMQAELQNSGLPPETLPPLDIMVPPEEPARVVAWLCSPEADAFLGREFSVYDEDLRKAAGL